MKCILNRKTGTGDSNPLIKKGTMKSISKIQYISQGGTPAEHLLNIKEVCKGGVDWVQLRLKKVSDELYAETAVLAKGICDAYQVKLIINDNVQVAQDIQADGVHLGKEDMHPEQARQILGSDKIIGGTANTLDDCIRLSQVGVDYIGLGPYRFTTTKENLSPVLGIEGYQSIVRDLVNREVNLPIIGIGGIQPEDVIHLHHTGVHGIAISGALTNTNNIDEVIENFRNTYSQV